MSAREGRVAGGRSDSGSARRARAARARARMRAGGAIYVETLVALPVILLFFFITWQLFDMFTAHLIVRHAADAAARAAAVIAPDEPTHYNGQPIDDLGGGQRLQDVRAAAIAVLNAHPHLNGTQVNVSVDPFTHTSLVTVHVDAQYHCRLNWVNAVCGFSGSRTLSSRGEFPYQAADVEWTQ
jgi:Flp pilus assembly protein TadG